MFSNWHKPAARLSVVLGNRIRGAGRGGGVGSETLRGAGTGRLGPSSWLTGAVRISPLAVCLSGVWVSSPFSASSSSSSLSSKGLGGEEERGASSSVAPSPSFSPTVSKGSAVLVGTGATVTSESFAGTSASFVRPTGDGVSAWFLSEGGVRGVVLRPMRADWTAAGLLLRSGRPFWLAKADLPRWCLQTSAPESPPSLYDPGSSVLWHSEHLRQEPHNKTVRWCQRLLRCCVKLQKMNH